MDACHYKNFELLARVPFKTVHLNKKYLVYTSVCLTFEYLFLFLIIEKYNQTAELFS